MREYFSAAALFTICIISSINAAWAVDISQFAKATKAYQPTGIERVENKIRIAVPQAQVSQEQYKSMIQEICYLQWSGETSLSQLDEIIILNEHAWSGWVFEQPSESCKALGEKKTDEFDPSLLSFTHQASKGW